MIKIKIEKKKNGMNEMEKRTKRKRREQVKKKRANNKKKGGVGGVVAEMVQGLENVEGGERRGRLLLGWCERGVVLEWASAVEANGCEEVVKVGL